MTQVADSRFVLSGTDRFLYQKFRSHLAIEWQLNPDSKRQFSSDDFRACNLEKFLDDDLSHSIGGLFAKWTHNKLIREVGVTRSKIPSNHLRKISLYEFTEQTKT
jgi:hypothetical protein